MPPCRAPSPSLPAPLRHIHDVVFRSLRTALTVLCRRRHEAEVTVTRFERSSADQPTRLRLGCSDYWMDAQIEVSHFGGNVYDVLCSVEEGPSRRFTYSMPGRGAPLSRTPELGRTLGAFLLNELERQIGRHSLHSQ